MLDAAMDLSREMVEERVSEALSGLDDPLADAMRYATTGGKGLRGFLVMESARLHGITPDEAAPAAAAIECLHAYSLVHDDLPCMDDDDLRRGQPTVHRKWDEGTALLTGDALQSLAFDLLAQTPCAPEARVVLMGGFARAAGIRGMVGGQAADIAAERSAEPLDLDQVAALQAGKTGALIRWSAAAGARMAMADPAPLNAYGDALGQAFQIADDLLDVEGDAESIGKAVGKDATRGKATFVSLLGVAAARERAETLVLQACEALAPYGAEAGTLKEAARFAIARRN